MEEVKSHPGEVNIALLLEPWAVSNRHYKQACKLAKHFDIILTYRDAFVKKRGKFHFYPFGGCWISPDSCQVYPKRKDVSIIASAKRGTGGQALRHKIVHTFQDRIDGLYGTGYKYVESKLEALGDYRYSIVVENTAEPNFFTEKIVDCFATGTVPIYWGCPNISEFFHPKGIITFRNLGELDDVLCRMGPLDYAERLPAIQENLARVDNYRTPEDWIFRHILSRLT